MGRCDRTTTKTRGLNRQRGKGAVQFGAVTVSQLGIARTDNPEKVVGYEESLGPALGLGSYLDFRPPRGV
jgi:hypothetical protein